MPDKTRPSVSEDECLLGGMGNVNGVNDQDSDANFFKVISENLKYAFQSPLPNTQFPTPYSNQQQQQQQQEQQEQQQQQQHSNSGENSSSLLENSMLPSCHAGSSGNALGNVNANGEPLNDMDMQPSSVLQFGNNFPNEFLLASPEQFREFLFESPAAGFNLSHKTPAKTPLRFISGNSNRNIENYESSNSNNLFGNPPSIKSSKDYNTNKFLQTPLRNIDLNLMFNSNQMAVSSSPSKKVALSLTPYGRKILNDIGTPYAKTLLSSNSALADFQKARKDVNRLQSTPPTLRKLIKTPQPKSRKKSLEIQECEQLNSFSLKVDNNINAAKGHNNAKNKNKNKSRKNSHDFDPDDARDIYGSSPTTIQLNSSVTKSTTKLNTSKIPVLTRDIIDSNIDNRLFKVEDSRLPLSPTPKCYKSTSTMDAIKIPELPKMGSFKSERTLSISSNISTSSNNSSMTTNTTTSSKSNKIKKNTKKQPKFQIIVANTQKFNVPTLNPKSFKKLGGLKRSQSLLVGSSSSSKISTKTNGNEVQKNDIGENGGFTSSKGSISSKKGRRSNSFSDKNKDKGQFYGYQ